MAVKLSRSYDFVSGRSKREERLTDYYFWSLESLRTELPFVCERPQRDIGCLRNFKGSEYRGNANRGETGDPCMPWESPELSFVLGKNFNKHLKAGESQSPSIINAQPGLESTKGETFWANVLWANVFMDKCLYGQTSYGQMFIWANVL
jgi:hypothetical protein